MKMHRSISLVACVLLVISSRARAENLQGTVTDESNHPVPGLTVSLVHPKAGRSAPVFTDSSGHYSFPNVPLEDDAYFLEVYWGKDVLYRKEVKIHGTVTQDIKLRR
jgi:hypothetical protein